MHQPDPTLPPRLTGHPLKAPDKPCAAACAAAAAGTHGAADFFWSRNTGRAECALILEPEISLARACQMSALGFVALNETLGHVGPPQMPVEIRWPGTLLVNGAACGEIRLTAPSRDNAAVPLWLVLSFDLTLSSHTFSGEPGERLGVTALDLEGASDVTRTAVIETLARCLIAWLHSWSDAGFRQIHDHWLYAADGRNRDVTIAGVTGHVVGLDEEGGVMLRTPEGRVRVIPYLPHVAVWAD